MQQYYCWNLKMWHAPSLVGMLLLGFRYMDVVYSCHPLARCCLALAKRVVDQDLGLAYRDIQQLSREMVLSLGQLVTHFPLT